MGYTQPFSFLLSPDDKIIGIHTNIRVKIDHILIKLGS